MWSHHVSFLSEDHRNLKSPTSWKDQQHPNWASVQDSGFKVFALRRCMSVSCRRSSIHEQENKHLGGGDDYGFLLCLICGFGLVGFWCHSHNNPNHETENHGNPA